MSVGRGEAAVPGVPDCPLCDLPRGDLCGQLLTAAMGVRPGDGKGPDACRLPLLPSILDGPFVSPPRRDLPRPAWLGETGPYLACG